MNPRSKNTIEDSEAALKNIFMQVPAMIAILKGHEYVFDFANPAYMEMVDNLNLTGKTLLEARPELEGQGFIELLDNVYKTGETFFGKEMPMMFNRNGKHEQAYVNFSYQAFKNTNGETEGILVFANEVTETVIARKLIEESEESFRMLAVELEVKVKERTQELNTKNTELERSNAELASFNSFASHDLQEPLRSISNYTGLLAKKNNNKDEDTNEYMNYIIEAAARMSALIKDLLEYSRIGKDIAISEIDCDKILHEVLKDFALSIKENGAEIHSDKLPVLNGYVHLKSVFQNLLSNAIKYKKDGMDPLINITVQDKEKEWLFAIKDNGIGIEKKYYHKLFVIFQRLHTRAEYPGTGIGLANCKKVVELHGGKIWVESELGKGSAFYFTIPKTII